MIESNEFDGMDPYEKMQRASAFMLEAFQDFKAMMESLGNGGSDVEDDYDSEKYAEDSQSKRYQASECYDEEPQLFAQPKEDFPGRPSYDYTDLNPDDPKFYSGYEIGIPVGVVVRSTSGQDRLIPIQNSYGE